MRQIVTFKVLYKSGVRETFRTLGRKGDKERFRETIIIPSFRDNSSAYIDINHKHTIRLNEVARITIK